MTAATYDQVLDAIKSGIPLDIDEFKEGYWEFYCEEPAHSFVAKAYEEYIFAFIIPEATADIE